jgi:putative peptidoglycan lipid II flippase
VGIIIGAIYFVPLWGLKGLAAGVVMGAALHMLIQLPSVFILGYRYRAFINFKDINLKRIAKMMGPRTLSLATAQINLLVITIVASSLPSGSLAIFNFANNLQTFPIGIFGISFAVAAFPILSAVSHDSRKLIANFSSTVRQILFFIIPATVLIITLRAQIIRVVLGTGLFDWNDTIMTMETLAFFLHEFVRPGFDSSPEPGFLRPPRLPHSIHHRHLHRGVKCFPFLVVGPQNGRYRLGPGFLLV